MTYINTLFNFLLPLYLIRFQPGRLGVIHPLEEVARSERPPSGGTWYNDIHIYINILIYIIIYMYIYIYNTH